MATVPTGHGKGTGRWHVRQTVAGVTGGAGDDHREQGSRPLSCGLLAASYLPIVVNGRLRLWRHDCHKTMQNLGSGTKVLRLDQVSLRFGEGSPILNAIDFELAAGDFQFLTGPSGAGKTSLLRIMSMSLEPTSGRCQLFGEDASALPRAARPKLRRRIGFVYQDFRPLRIVGQLASDYSADVMDLLDWVGLSARADDFPPALSGGEKQRVAIARAVIAKPELILADEPTGSVDPVHARRLLRLFAELNKQGTTVFLATHDESLLKQASAPVVHLADGQLRQR
jgi:cell division transport system ATP-binding protein